MWRATHCVLTILYGGWRQHVVTNVHRSDTPAPLTGGQEQAVKHHHLVPEVISALIYPGKRKELCSIKKRQLLFVFFRLLISIFLPCSPESIWTSCILTEKVICFAPPGNTPTLQYYKWHRIFNSIKLILSPVNLFFFFFTNNTCVYETINLSHLVLQLEYSWRFSIF